MLDRQGLRGGIVNGSQSWADAPQNGAPLFVPTRLELMKGADEWVGNLPNVTQGWEIIATETAQDGKVDEVPEDARVFQYDLFIRNLLDDYTDSEIFQAQWLWIQDTTERMEAENNTKGDADE